MRLEMATYPVKDVRFGKQSKYDDGVLEIEKEQLISLILEDERIKWADMDVAFPGEKTRIVFIRDVEEPRVKVSGPGCIFPGILGPIEAVGDGRTHRLSGITVMPSAQYPFPKYASASMQIGSMLDMWGPGQSLSPFGSTINVVPILRLIDDVTELDAHYAIQLAGFKVANRLAEATRDQAPENTETFELAEVDPSLPKVIYVCGFTTMKGMAHTITAFYGYFVEESLPTFIHPNEFFDGILTSDARVGDAASPTNWEWMNQPVARNLLREHGKRLNFLGVILQRTRFLNQFGKQMTAVATAKMAKLLGADGAIVTRGHTSGNNEVDFMLTVQALERNGVSTCVLTPERGGKGGSEPSLMYYVPEANAIVSTGSRDYQPILPSPDKVIGSNDREPIQLFLGDTPFNPWEKVSRPSVRDYCGGIDALGTMSYTCKDY